MQTSAVIRAVLVITIGFVLSIWLGVSIVTDQFQTLLKFAGVGLLLLCVFLGRRIWLLMVAFTSLGIPLVRGYTTAELGQSLLLGFGMMLIMMRRLPLRIKFGELEWWRIIVALLILQVYLRNPVGLGIFGAGSVGGKPYFLAALAFMVSWIYGGLIVEARELKWAMYVSLIFSFIGIPLSEARTQSGVAAAEGAEQGQGQAPVEEGAATRVGYLGGIAILLSRWIVSRVNPLKASFHPLWAPLILISLAAAAGSGFRNTIAIVGMTYILGLAYHGGGISVFFAGIMGTAAIFTLAMINLFLPLPPNVQRTLTVFPGTWEQRYKDDAKGSTDWRVEMWKEALFTDRWIENKWLGDGLGMSAAELARSKELSSNRRIRSSSGIGVHQENVMINGDYHSGPVQTIRTVGYVGLAVLLAAMIRVAVHAHRQIQRCRGTEWFPVALYFGLGMISGPIIFVFIFGDFGRAAVGLFMSSAFIRLLENNIPLPAWQKRVRQPYLLNSHRNLAGRRTTLSEV